MPVHLCNILSSSLRSLWTHLKIHSGGKPNKCKYCNYAFSRADSLRTHLKTHCWLKSLEKNQTNATSVISHLLIWAVFFNSFEQTQWREVKKCHQCDRTSIRAGNLKKISKHILGKSRTNAIYVNMHLLNQAIWGDLWKHIMERNQRNVTNSILHLIKQFFEGTFQNLKRREVKQMQPILLHIFLGRHYRD